MKFLWISLCTLLLCLSSCSTSKKYTAEQYEQAKVQFQNSINTQDLKNYLEVYASDAFEGRRTGERGQKLATEYLAGYYKSNGIKPPKVMGKNYFQKVPKEYINEKKELVNADSENVLAFIKGSEFPDEVVVLSAHLDHLGVNDGEIYNGADDDGSGTVAIMEIAQAMQMAVKKGYRPRRSVLFLHVTGEELGLWGSKFYSENPVFPMKNTVSDLNIDMIGRIDEAHTDNPRYVYPIGSDMLSDELHDILITVNDETEQLELDFKYNKKDDPNRFYYRSDHYNFAKYNVPVIFFFNGVHEDYHKPSDTVDKINFEILQDRTRLIFSVLWRLLNRDQRIQLKEGITPL